MARSLHNPNRAERLTKLAASQQRLANRYGLTTVRAVRTATAGVHLSFETGLDDLAAICGAMEHKEMETVDLPSHCGNCVYVVNAMGLDHLLRDDDGWTGLYVPRGYRGNTTW